MQVAHPSRDLLRRVPVWLYLFDLLYLDRYDTRQLPLRWRKTLLSKAFAFRGFTFTDHRDTEGEAYYREACRKGWEGLIAKNGDSVYVSKRTRDWLKFKCIKEQEFVVGGYTEPRGSQSVLVLCCSAFIAAEGSSMPAKSVPASIVRCYSRLRKKLAALTTPISPFDGQGLPRSGVHWVKPKLVAQIAFTEWTRDYKLRHPQFLGLREDKNRRR